jgi:hypothetical protein
VIDLQRTRCAAGAECRRAENGLGAVLDRSHRRWCSESCRNVAYRRARGIPARLRRPDAIADRATSPPSSLSGVGVPVVKCLNTRALAGKPSCPSCGSIFIGRVPETCPDCDTSLKKVATA